MATMLKENWRLISRAERLGDFAIIIVSFFLAYHGRDSLIFWNEQLGWGIPFGGPSLAPVKDYTFVLIVAVVGYVIMLNSLGAYASMRLSSSLRMLYVSAVSSFVVFFSLAAVLFLFKVDLSRSFIGLFCFLAGILLLAERYLVLEVLRFWRKRGKNYRNVLICGVGDQARRIALEISARPELGVRVRGFADLRGNRENYEKALREFKTSLADRGFSYSVRVVSGLKPLRKALTDYAIDEVIFADVVDVMPLVEDAIFSCSEQGIRTTIVADIFSMGMVKSGLSYFNGIPLIHFQTPPGDRWDLAVKRIVDVAVSGTLLLVLAPLFAAIATAIKLGSNGSVIYTQRRVGLHGHLFNFYKFRSMQVNAERQQKNLESKNEMDGPVFKIKDDPRITAVGHFLRRHSLDELPQLWNVFIGDMSLVGPRPPVPSEVSRYERRYLRRLSMRPGMTCTWQVSARNEIKDFESWVKLDLDYIDNWSLGRDFTLLARTIPAVVMGTGR